ncbi:hypothetical protein RRF57_012478 [Xylaria bambusicola]|uniref:Biotrophy-associated secreted protein 2 n=1 Tax=Xylaria bambusicola TaxID=326684 RepID=A0AAN7V1S7_9PEZI
MTVTAIPAPAPALPDPAGDANVGNQNQGQFIGGQCINSLDCASTCCATFGSIGLCSGVGAQFQAGKTGCGFGDGGAAATPATPDNSTGSDNSGTDNAGNTGNNGNSGNSGNASSGTVTVDPNAAGSQNVGLGNGSQFITGQCLSDADCASGCCATDGKCAARAVVESAQDPRECGFVGTLARL